MNQPGVITIEIDVRVQPNRAQIEQLSKSVLLRVRRMGFEPSGVEARARGFGLDPSVFVGSCDIEPQSPPTQE